MSTSTGYRWIALRRGDREPIIRGTRLTVAAIVSCYKEGMDIVEILEGYPGLLPAQLHEALAYYYDHQDEIEQLLAPVDPKEYAASLGLRLTDEGYLVKDDGLARK
ncbi:MAG TPA: DUF433 domain-containing protein [Planctomycetota bacterium]|nr:DUF433 domain-containing protein [Planctomycetota bacterium]